MNTQKRLVIVASQCVHSLSCCRLARASEEDQATKLTFNKAVQIPGAFRLREPTGSYGPKQWTRLTSFDFSTPIAPCFMRRS
jgi:hypothetical protein